MSGRVRVGLVLVVGALLMSLLPGVWAATTITISDPSNDAQLGPVPANPADDQALAHLDITEAVADYRADENLIVYEVTVGAELSDDRRAPTSVTRVSAFPIWEVNFVDASDQQWALRASFSGLPGSLNVDLCGPQNLQYETDGDGQDLGHSVDGDTFTFNVPLDVRKVGGATGDTLQWDLQGSLTDIHARTGLQQAANSGGPPSACDSGATLVDETSKASESLDVETPLPDISLETSTASPTIEAGGEGNVTINATNDGGNAAEISFNLSAPSGWTVSADPSSLTLDSGSTRNTTVDIQPPSDAMSSVVTVQALSDGRVAASLNLSVAVTGGQGPAGTGDLQLTADTTEQTVRPGSTATYELTVTNGADSERTYRLEASGDEGWLQLGSEEVTVSAGSSVQVQATVPVPADAASGSVTHTVEASATGNASASAQVELTTTVETGSSDGGGPGGASTPGFEILGVVAAAGAALVWSRDRR